MRDRSVSNVCVLWWLLLHNLMLTAGLQWSKHSQQAPPEPSYTQPITLSFKSTLQLSKTHDTIFTSPLINSATNIAQKCIAIKSNDVSGSVGRSAQPREKDTALMAAWQGGCYGNAAARSPKGQAHQKSSPADEQENERDEINKKGEMEVGGVVLSNGAGV